MLVGGYFLKKLIRSPFNAQRYAITTRRGFAVFLDEIKTACSSVSALVEHRTCVTVANKEASVETPLMKLKFHSRVADYLIVSAAKRGAF